MTRQTVTVYNAQDLAPKMRSLYDWCKSMTMAGHKIVVEAVDSKSGTLFGRWWMHNV